MAKVREIRIPIVRQSTSAPWHFFAFAIALIPAAALSAAAGNKSVLISAVLSSAAAVTSLFLIRIALRKKSSLVIPIGIALGCSIAFFLPPGIPMYIAPLAVCVSAILFQMLSLQRTIRVNMGVIAIMIVLAARYALDFTVAPSADILSGTNPDKIIHAIGQALLDEGKNPYPAFSLFSIIPAAIILYAMGAINIRNIMFSLAGAVTLIAILHLTNHDILFLAGWRIGLAPFIYVLLFFSSDPLSSSRTSAGKAAASLITGAAWPLIFFISGSILLSSVSIIALNIVTPILDKVTIPRPFGPAREQRN